MTARRGKKRQFNFAAIEHVGNDADEGGFLGNEEAEQERRTGKEGTETQLPSPASEPTPAAVSGSAEAAAAAGPQDQRAGELPAPEVLSSAAGLTAPQAPQPSAASLPAESPVEPEPERTVPAPSPVADVPPAPAASPSRASAAPPRAVRPSGRVNDGPAFSPLSAEPPVLRAAKPKRTGKKDKPAQAAVLASFIAQRTGRNWGMWSGRLVPDTVARLQARAEADAASSGRGRLSAGHYLDAALRSLPQSAEEQVALANEWLIQQWDGEHPAGRSAQFSVSPESAALLNGLRQSLRAYRHGIVIDVVCAAVDTFLDVLEAEGPIEG
ncbi:hypothetical protein ACFP1Z_28710 [Streptomyces gamaensis]|uniref:Uncharacterized protein n=1 Tax=Streptomyces gamaensis TaxID=1763542 RepID=A0ABW0ZCT7_9ACTN